MIVSKTDRDAVWDVDSGGPMNLVLDTVQFPPPMRRGNFEGEGAAHCKVWGLTAVSCAKISIEMPFWGVDLGDSKEACIRWGCTLALPGE